MTGVIPALFLCGGIAFAALFPIGRQGHLAVREELARRKLGALPQGDEK